MSATTNLRRQHDAAGLIVAEQQAIFATLADRIKRENNQLYPLADELAATPSNQTAA